MNYDGQLLQGQIMVAQHKSACILLIIGSKGTVNLQETITCKCFGALRFVLGPLLQGQTMAAQNKSAYILLILDICNVQSTFKGKP